MKLSYKTLFIVKMITVVLLVEIISHIHFMKPISIDEISVLFSSILFKLIWFAVFMSLSAFITYIIKKYKMKRSSLCVIASVCFLFLIVCILSTVLVVVGSPFVTMLMLTARFIGYSAEMAKLGRIMFFTITPLMFYMYLCIVMYNDPSNRGGD